MRKCILKGDNKKAYFHRWVEHSNYVRGLVELEEDGQVLEVVPEEIIFKEPPAVKCLITTNNPYFPEVFGRESFFKQKDRYGISEDELEKMPEFLRKKFNRPT